MGILGTLFGGGIAAAADGVASAIDRFVETPEEKKAAELLLTKAQQEPDKWQAEINRIEAAHRSIFVAGWRPFIGWVCGFGLAWEFLLKHAVSVILQAFAITVALPAIQTGALISLVLALLGMGSLRTYEKRNKLSF